MKRSFIFILFIFFILIGGCVLNKKEVSTIKISVEKEYIIPNGIDEVFIFIEMYDATGNKVDGFLSDCYVDGKKLSGNIFKTTKNGKYEIYSKLGNIVSNKITVYADLKLNLISSRNVIDIEDENKQIDFSVEALSNGVSTNIMNIKYFVNNEELENSSFIPEKTGTYNVRAKCGDVETQTIAIKVFSVKSITINLSKKEILPNNADSTIISIEKLLDEDGNDIREKYKTEYEKYYASKIFFYNGDEKIEGNIFKNTRKGEYNIYAKYRKTISQYEKVKVYAKLELTTDRGLIFEEGANVNIGGKVFDSNNIEIADRVIKYYINEKEILVNNYTFSSVGKYEIKAILGDVTSTIAIKVVPRILSFNSKGLSSWELSSKDSNLEGIIMTADTNTMMIKSTQLGTKEATIQSVQEIDYTKYKSISFEYMVVTNSYFGVFFPGSRDFTTDHSWSGSTVIKSGTTYLVKLDLIYKMFYLYEGSKAVYKAELFGDFTSKGSFGMRPLNDNYAEVTVTLSNLVFDPLE